MCRPWSSSRVAVGSYLTGIGSVTGTGSVVTTTMIQPATADGTPAFGTREVPNTALPTDEGIQENCMLLLMATETRPTGRRRLLVARLASTMALITSARAGVSICAQKFLRTPHRSRFHTNTTAARPGRTDSRPAPNLIGSSSRRWRPTIPPRLGDFDLGGQPQRVASSPKGDTISTPAQAGSLMLAIVSALVSERVVLDRYGSTDPQRFATNGQPCIDRPCSKHDPPTSA